MTVNRAKTVTMSLTPADVEQAIIEYAKRQDRSVKNASSASVAFAVKNEVEPFEAADAFATAEVTLTVPMRDKAAVLAHAD